MTNETLPSEHQYDVRYARTSDGQRVAYGIAGSGPPLILLPATLLQSNFSRSTWGRNWSRLGDEFSVVMYDHLGSGLSDRVSYDYTLSGFEAEFRAVLDALDTDRVAIAAPPAGGPMALEFTARHPERVSSLSLLWSWARGSDYVEHPRFASYRRSFEDDWILGIESFVRLNVGLHSERAEAEAALIRETCDQRTYLSYLDALAGHDATGFLREVSTPTLVLGNSRALFHRVEVSRDLAASIDGARFMELDGNGSRAFREVRAFSAQHAGRRSGVPASGFQTILFTDLEGSTALTQRLGDEGAQELLRGHNAAVRAALNEHGGHEVKHTGDGIMASFPSAVSAVTAALQMQRDLAGGEVRVRIGLNAGEPIAEDDDLFGLSVIKAARIGDRAEPGQVLVSDVVRQLCEGKTFTFTSIGDVTLKGFDEPVTLYEVTA